MFDEDLIENFGHKYAGLVVLEQLADELDFKTPKPIWSPGFSLWKQILERKGDELREYVNANIARKELSDITQQMRIDGRGDKIDEMYGEEVRSIKKRLKRIDEDVTTLPKDLDALCARQIAELPGDEITLRSSMSCEDHKDNIFAGQFSSVWVYRDDFCWDTPVSYFIHENLHVLIDAKMGVDDVEMNFIAQPGVTFETGGVVFSKLPGTDITLIEVSDKGPRMVTMGDAADVIDIQNNEIVYVSGRKSKYSWRTPRKDFPGSPKFNINGEDVCIDQDQAKEVARISNALESKLGFPVNVEFGYSEGTLYLLQVRPTPSFNDKIEPITTDPLIKSYFTLSPGRAIGRIIELPGHWNTTAILRQFEERFPGEDYFVTGRTLDFTEQFSRISEAHPHVKGILRTGADGSRVGHDSINLRQSGILFLAFHGRPNELDSLLNNGFNFEDHQVKFSYPVIGYSDGYRGGIYSVE